MGVLKVIATVVQILSGAVGLFVFIRNNGGPAPGLILPSLGIGSIAVALYAYIIHDFADAVYWRLPDWRRVVVVAGLAFILLTCIVFRDWRAIVGSFVVSLVAVIAAQVQSDEADS